MEKEMWDCILLLKREYKDSDKLLLNVFFYCFDYIMVC